MENPKPANARVVEHGVNGLHATTEDEWVEGLASLLRDEPRRTSLGARARQTVEEGYSCRVQAPRMARILKDAAR
jgi:glycosyltransferase involved in cell wall biosynthesis